MFAPIAGLVHLARPAWSGNFNPGAVWLGPLRSPPSGLWHVGSWSCLGRWLVWALDSEGLSLLGPAPLGPCPPGPGPAEVCLGWACLVEGLIGQQANPNEMSTASRVRTSRRRQSNPPRDQLLKTTFVFWSWPKPRPPGTWALGVGTRDPPADSWGVPNWPRAYGNRDLLNRSSLHVQWDVDWTKKSK